MKKSKKRIKALCLLSGGSDSRLATVLTKEQADVEAVFFDLPFGSGCSQEFCAFKFTQLQLLKLHIIDCTKNEMFKEYIEIITNPKHGYGSAMNPCIDCHIFMLKKAKKLAKKIGADFLVTGEVLNKRPFSQHRMALDLIENESGLKGKILRPLSAKLLPKTTMEKQGKVDINKLFNISGRSRKEQIRLAKKYKIRFINPAGGCLLCEKKFTIKLKDLLQHKKKISEQDVKLLQTGRHFRIDNTKIIIGRDHEENLQIKNLAGKNDLLMEVKEIPSPITLVTGRACPEKIKKAAKLTARYSDADGKAVVRYAEKVNFDKNWKEVIVKNKISKEEIEKLRVK